MTTFKKIRANVKKYFKLIKILYKDERTPRISKVFLWLAIGYAAIFFDLIPDFVPIIGLVDDAIIIPSLVFFAFKFIPKDVYKKDYRKIFGKNP